MKYASVVVTFNRKEMLVKSLERFLNQDSKPQRIIVVDNASTDGTDQLMQEKYGDNPVIKYVRLAKNVGGAGGFNHGLHEAVKENVDWISIADDDALFNQDFFTKIEKATEKYPDVQAFSGTVIHGQDITEIMQRRRITNWHTLSFEAVPESEYNHDFEYDLFTFVGVVFKKELIKKIGFPEEDFFIWHERTEYSIRVRKHTRVINVSAAQIYHQNVIGDDAFAWAPTWKEYYGIRNKIQVIKKYGHPRVAVWLQIAYMYVKKMVANAVKPERKGYRKFQVMAARDGFHDGLHNQLGKNDKYLPGMKIKRDNED